MLITLEQLRAVCIYSSAGHLEPFIEPLNAAMKEFEINTKKRIAAFIAQVAHESGSFQYMQELASGAAYDKRSDLGNTLPEAIAAAAAGGKSVGRFYRGHGCIQITGYYNHLKCGEALGLDLVNQPTLLTQPVNACRSAAWFWDSRNLNALADMGDFKKITKRINGGYTHLEQRSEFYVRALDIL